MLTHVINQSIDILAVTAAPAPGSGTTLNTTGIVTFIVSKIVPILLAVVGVIILSRSGKGQWSQALTTGGIAVLGVIFIAGAGLLFAFGESIARLALGG
jgi:hypothetical protein